MSEDMNYLIKAIHIYIYACIPYFCEVLHYNDILILMDDHINNNLKTH